MQFSDSLYLGYLQSSPSLLHEPVGKNSVENMTKSSIFGNVIEIYLNPFYPLSLKKYDSTNHESYFRNILKYFPAAFLDRYTKVRMQIHLNTETQLLDPGGGGGGGYVLIVIPY